MDKKITRQISYLLRQKYPLAQIENLPVSSGQHERVLDFLGVDDIADFPDNLIGGDPAQTFFEQLQSLSSTELEKKYREAKDSKVIKTSSSSPLTKAPYRTYTTPYIDLMLKAIDEFGPKLAKMKKWEIMDWLRTHCPSDCPSTQNTMKNMATFLRPVAARKGGNSRWNPSTPPKGDTLLDQ